MRAATELLTQYAAYHRDRRNIATHFVGVPMIVFARRRAAGAAALRRRGAGAARRPGSCFAPVGRCGT